jgi:UDP-N-acetylmuramyl pentapeptide phosphotransferase/UDP-N-acetylglucosamine-1-phosphate transferase
MSWTFLMSGSLLLPAVVSAAAAFVLVGVVRQTTLRHGVLDHPTDRSSHDVPTPRGGGVGLLIVALGMSTWRAAHQFSPLLLIPLAGVTAVALVGWIDDRRGLGVRPRLAVHFAAAIGAGVLAAAGTSEPLIGAAILLWWAFWTVSSINLVNFMDGINGLVASQVAIFALSLAAFPDPANSASFYSIAVAAACLGFLPWNFPRARIFLGDVGSGGLGYLLPILSLLAMRGQGIDFVQAHLPLLPLFGDATWTIVRRWRNGERVTTPHRSHLYQRLANGGLGHTRVTLIYAAGATCGALVAHTDRFSLASPWIVLYAAGTVLLGLLLHQWTRQAGRALT